MGATEKRQPKLFISFVFFVSIRSHIGLDRLKNLVRSSFPELAFYDHIRSDWKPNRRLRTHIVHTKTRVHRPGDLCVPKTLSALLG
jgi:hypothetical protein